VTDPQPDEPEFGDASRRTYFAQERTLLAWWRTGIGAAAVAIGIGGLVPHFTGLPKARFLALAAGYGILALVFIVGGTVRTVRSQQVLERGSHAHPSWPLVYALTAYLAALVILTVLALF